MAEVTKNAAAPNVVGPAAPPAVAATPSSAAVTSGPAAPASDLRNSQPSVSASPSSAASIPAHSVSSQIASTTRVQSRETAELTPAAILTATGALLAFLIGLYTLIGRERKSPYLINTLFEVLIWCVLAVICSVAALFTPWSRFLVALGGLSLLVALTLTLWRVHKMYMRFALFVDSANPKQLYFVRWLKHVSRRVREHKPYEWNATPLSPTLQKSISDILKSPDGEGAEKPLSSAALLLDQHGKANELLARLAIAFLAEKRSVQYMTASRHPLEFIAYLREEAKRADLAWTEISEKIVVVDAYTKHFGYADSVYLKATSTLKTDFGITCVRSGESFAGLHTASSNAFNILKEKSKSNTREPVLVIYEDCYAIADLESREQYRIFIRHVVPSERMWEGMFTVFAETAQDTADWKLLAAYCDVALDTTKPVA